MSDTDRAQSLAEYANASAQRNQPITPVGRAIARPMPNAMLDDEEGMQVVGARAVEVHRDESVILKKISALAAAAGPDWFYRYPVRTKEGQDWIDGPSIKLANAVAHLFMNNDVDIRELDVGDAWVFYARFTDWENGTRMTRAFRQRKSQSTMRTRDADRQLDIAYQIGQSKAIRNVICNAITIYTDYAYEEAHNSNIDKIGRDLEGSRRRTLEALAALPVEVHRVERVMGRSAKDWLAPDIARVNAMGKAIKDGMATIDESFPPTAAEETPPAATTPVGEQPQSASEAPSAGDSAAQSQPQDTALAEAYKRGQEAKAAGHARKAMPPEYREVARSREGLAWHAGWDGTAMPMV